MPIAEEIMTMAHRDSLAPQRGEGLRVRGEIAQVVEKPPDRLEVHGKPPFDFRMHLDHELPQGAVVPEKVGKMPPLFSLRASASPRELFSTGSWRVPAWSESTLVVEVRHSAGARRVGWGSNTGNDLLSISNCSMHCRQMQARLRSSGGTRSCKAAGMALAVHQQGPLAVAGLHNWQAFGPPHKGQHLGSGGNVFTALEYFTQNGLPPQWRILPNCSPGSSKPPLGRQPRSVVFPNVRPF